MGAGDGATDLDRVQEGPVTATSVNGVALAVFIALFAFVTAMGFIAARWRRGESATLR